MTEILTIEQYQEYYQGLAQGMERKLERAREDFGEFRPEIDRELAIDVARYGEALPPLICLFLQLAKEHRIDPYSYGGECKCFHGCLEDTSKEKAIASSSIVCDELYGVSTKVWTPIETWLFRCIEMEVLPGNLLYPERNGRFLLFLLYLVDYVLAQQLKV